MSSIFKLYNVTPGSRRDLQIFLYGLQVYCACWQISAPITKTPTATLKSNKRIVPSPCVDNYPTSTHHDARYLV